jgi:hypothetical protein
MLKEKNLKAIVHGALALLAIAEAFNCKSRTRKMFVGACAGWHAHSFIYHSLYEKELDIEDEKN